MASFADAIEPVQDLGGAVSFPVDASLEEAGQTFLYGMPVMFAAGDGGVQLWDGTAGAGHLIAGVAAQNAQNLATLGAGAPTGFSPILGPGSSIGNFAANSSQSLAVITPPMTPMTDGFNYYFIAAPTTVFKARIGTTGSVATATVGTQKGSAFGLTKDTGNNFWYVDISKTGASAVLQVVGFDPLDPIGTVGGHVLFVFLYADVSMFA
jgi:hypothetical protein